MTNLQFSIICVAKTGADQLSGSREAGLRLCFRLCRLLVFPCGGSYIFEIIQNKHINQQISKSD